MKRVCCLIVLSCLLAGCANLRGGPDVGEARSGGINSDVLIRPKARPSGLANAAPPPSSTARTAEGLDTTSREQRSAAQQAPVAADRALGTTIASLGSPTEPGFWLKTPLVSAQVQGRVVYPATGKSVQVTLIPIDGPATAGSRMSLPALRLIEAPLTGLPEVQVFAEI